MSIRHQSSEMCVSDAQWRPISRQNPFLSLLDTMERRHMVPRGAQCQCAVPWACNRRFDGLGTSRSPGKVTWKTADLWRQIPPLPGPQSTMETPTGPTREFHFFRKKFMNACNRHLCSVHDRSQPLGTILNFFDIGDIHACMCVCRRTHDRI